MQTGCSMLGGQKRELRRTVLASLAVVAVVLDHNNSMENLDMLASLEPLEELVVEELVEEFVEEFVVEVWVL